MDGLIKTPDLFCDRVSTNTGCSLKSLFHQAAKVSRLHSALQKTLIPLPSVGSDNPRHVFKPRTVAFTVEKGPHTGGQSLAVSYTVIMAQGNSSISNLTCCFDYKVDLLLTFWDEPATPHKHSEASDMSVKVVGRDAAPPRA